MEEEKVTLEAEIQQKETELNQLTEDIEKAEGDEKQVLEDRKAALVADVDAKKARLDELNREPPEVPAEVPPAPSEDAGGEPAPAADKEPATGSEPVLLSGSEPKFEAPPPKPEASDEPKDSGNLTREQMLKILQDGKAKAAAQLTQSPQDRSGKPLGDDMDKWLATLKNLKQDGIISESDVKVDKIEAKIKAQPGGDSKKIQEEIDVIDRIISIQDENEFQKEFSQWYEKNQSAALEGGSTGGPRGQPGVKGNIPVPDASVLSQLKEAEVRAIKAAAEVEVLKKKLAEYAQKESMTAEDVKDMEEKQKLLMDKMAEFEQITKLIQSLIGLSDTPSSQLGVQPSRDGDKAGQPEENLPKVIVCGTGDIDTVPKIIVCETSGEKEGKKPVFQELDGPVRDRPGTVGVPGRQASYPGGTGSPAGYGGGAGGYGGDPGVYGYGGPGGPWPIYPGGPGGAGPIYPGGPGGAGPIYPGGPGRAGPIFPGGPGGAGPIFPGGPGAFPGLGGPGAQVPYPASPSPYTGYPAPYPSTFPGMPPIPPCLDYYNKSKEDKKKKKKQTDADYRISSGCNDWCKKDYEKKREKKKKKCFCQLAGFCPKN